MANLSRITSIRLSNANQKKMKEIVKRTGEKQTALFERLIETEHERIMNNASLPESIYNKVEHIEKEMIEAEKSLQMSLENTTNIREHSNRILCSVFFSIKELFRTMHFISGCYSNTTLLSKDQLSIISNKADDNAAESFASVVKMLSEYKPNDIVALLRKK